MSGNRTKTDWAYKQAQKIQQDVVDMALYTPHAIISRQRAENVRKIAGVLRRVSRCAYQRGYNQGYGMNSGDQRQ